MPVTSNYSLPYQGLGDAPDGPDLGEDLAVAVDTELLRIDGEIADVVADLAPLLPLLGIKGVDTATVATAQTLGASAYTDLATAGPAVTMTTGTKALVIVTGLIFVTNVANVGRMGFAVSGATTIAAADTSALISNTLTPGVRASAAKLVTLNAGSNVFTAKYSSTGSTSTFTNRDIIVIGFA